MSYKTVIVEKGRGGWGTPLEILPKEGQKIVSITGGRIHPIAQQISDLTGAPVVEGTKSLIPNEEIACAIINCGGTARVGILPKNNVKTININGGGPSGPLAKYVKEGIYVSGVKEKNIKLKED